MDYHVTWLPGAIDDLGAIAEYIGADSQAHAASVVMRILDSVIELPRFPRSHRRVPEWPDENVRQRIVFNYRVIFRVCDEIATIEVLAVIHGARLLPDELRERV
ncbi:MAG: type II toxin-antitoxin system RelE/ParE family toxin [Planctomycetes bacterium]|nr:type II toxin-antitoxin system RelE/ParE family toxin [Planctomycetota bacterium]